MRRDNRITSWSDSTRERASERARTGTAQRNPDCAVEPRVSSANEHLTRFVCHASLVCAAAVHTRLSTSADTGHAHEVTEYAESAAADARWPAQHDATDGDRSTNHAVADRHVKRDAMMAIDRLRDMNRRCNITLHFASLVLLHCSLASLVTLRV
jgi:hypothetical protein